MSGTPRRRGSLGDSTRVSRMLTPCATSLPGTSTWVCVSESFEVPSARIVTSGTPLWRSSMCHTPRHSVVPLQGCCAEAARRTSTWKPKMFSWWLGEAAGVNTRRSSLPPGGSCSAAPSAAFCYRPRTHSYPQQLCRATPCVSKRAPVSVVSVPLAASTVEAERRLQHSYLDPPSGLGFSASPKWFRVPVCNLFAPTAGTAVASRHRQNADEDLGCVDQTVAVKSMCDGSRRFFA